MQAPLTAVSLFSSGGIGDLALCASGITVIVANELLKDRASVFRANFPATRMIVGDINLVADEIDEAIDRELAGRRLDLIFATPPCQGMSKNGMGKLLREAREGRRPAFDQRNRLVIPVVEMVKRHLPRVLIMENVAEMARTLIEGESGPVAIEDYLHQQLAPMGYIGGAGVVEFADYGVPQRRKRLITVFTRDARLSLAIKRSAWLAPPTHAAQATLMRSAWRTVDEVIGGLPALDASAKQRSESDYHPLHRVPILDEHKYFWVSSTPPGATAFDNQCRSEGCEDVSNPIHGSRKDSSGINQSDKYTPVRCRNCGHLLPRPWVKSGPDFRIMSGFTSAYKRMKGDLPASALTRNLSYACSDQKLHPTQHRVLSLHEAEILHTITEFEWKWIRDDGIKVSDKLIRDIIGESVPPLGLKTILEFISGQLLSIEQVAA